MSNHLFLHYKIVNRDSGICGLVKQCASIDEIDVQSIMTRLGGGGHVNIAGAQIQNRTIEEVRADLEETIDKMLEEGEIKL